MKQNVYIKKGFIFFRVGVGFSHKKMGKEDDDGKEKNVTRMGPKYHKE